jgi:hypothetical protein
MPVVPTATVICTPRWMGRRTGLPEWDAGRVGVDREPRQGIPHVPLTPERVFWQAVP